MRMLSDPELFLPGYSAMRAGAVKAGPPVEPKTLDEWAANPAPGVST